MRKKISDRDNFNKKISFMRELFQFIAIPLFFLFLFLIFAISYELLGLPSSEKLISIAKNFYTTHGYWVVFVAAILEGLLAVNWYLPGSAVIVLGVTLSHETPINPVIIVGLVMLGFFVTSNINYFLGRFAWYKIFMFLGLAKPLDKMKSRVEKHGLSIIFSTYFHPNVGALVATSAGILQLPFFNFVIYSSIAIIIWNTFWGIVVYLFGSFILRIAGMYVIIILISIWLLISVVRYFYIKHTKIIKRFGRFSCLKM